MRRTESVWLHVGEVQPAEEWCEKHACSKTRVALTSLSSTGVNPAAGTITFCHQCQDEKG